MDSILCNAIIKYYTTLSNIGVVNNKVSYDILLLFLINDLTNSSCFSYITDTNKRILEDCIEEILNSNCFLSSSNYSGFNNVNCNLVWK